MRAFNTNLAEPERTGNGRERGRHEGLGTTNESHQFRLGDNLKTSTVCLKNADKQRAPGRSPREPKGRYGGPGAVSDSIARCFRATGTVGDIAIG